MDNGTALNETPTWCANWTECDKTCDTVLNEYNEPKWLTPLFYMVTIIGILLNLVFLFTVVRVPALKSTKNHFLVNLLVADLMFLIFNALVYSLLINFSSRQFEVIKKCVLLIFGVLYSTSGLTIMMISVERYIAICLPFTYRRIASKSRANKLLIGIWLLSTVFNIPLFIASSLEWEDQLGLYMYAISTFPYWLSLIMTSVLYTVIIFKMSSGNRMSKDNAQDSRQVSQVDRVQVIRMLVITSAVFFVCLTPYVVLNLMISFAGYCYPTDYSSVATLLTLLNSSVNPIIYNLASTKYRRAMVSAFTFDPRQAQVVNTGKKRSSNLTASYH